MAAVRIEPAAIWIEWELIKGDSFDLVLPVLDKLNAPVDITVPGWTAKAQVRRSDVEPVLHEWSAAESNIELDADGVVLIVNGSITRLWAWRDAQISVEVTDPDDKPHTIAHGTIRALPEITQ